MSDKQNSDCPLTLGVLSPSLGGFYFGDMMTALHRHARTAGLCLLSIRAGHRSPMSLPLAHDLVDGWIIVGDCLTPVQLDQLNVTGKPVVSDAGHPGPAGGCGDQDPDRQASLAIETVRARLAARGRDGGATCTAAGEAGFGHADAAAIGYELSKDLFGIDAGNVLERLRLLAPYLDWACIGQWSDFGTHTDRLKIDHLLELKNADSDSDSQGLLGSEIAITAFPPPRDPPVAGRFTTVLPVLFAHKWTVLAVSGTQRSEEDVARYPMLMHCIDLLRQAVERSISDAESRASAERLRTASQEQANASLTEMNEKLSLAHEQLVQSEKLASIGQLAAGVAHEINNPIGYISSNFGTLEGYLADVFEVLDAYREAEPLISAPAAAKRLASLRGELELDMLKEDIPALMGECKEGISRVRKIVEDLKNFSRSDDQDEWQWADLHRGIDSTLNVINNEIKFKADVVRNYGVLPAVECLPSQINQVVMNLVINAVHAFREERGRIVISTGTVDEQVWIEVTDNGCGIPQKNLMRIFDPFFTTKPIGKGTGLGLSISYGIIQRHNGQITVHSEIGKGTSFRITLPIEHAAAP